MFAENGRFPAKTGGLESLFVLALTFLGLYTVNR